MTKSRGLFEHFQVSAQTVTHRNSWWILKYVDIPETLRRLFPIRPLVFEWELAVRFYPFLVILGGHFDAAGSRRTRWPTRLSCRDSTVPSSIFTGKLVTGPTMRYFLVYVSDFIHTWNRGTKKVTFSQRMWYKKICIEHFFPRSSKSSLP